MKITTRNIDTLIKTLEKATRKEPKAPIGLLIPEWWPTKEINRMMYRGKGRPRKVDYKYIHYTELFKNSEFLTQFK